MSIRRFHYLVLLLMLVAPLYAIPTHLYYTGAIGKLNVIQADLRWKGGYIGIIGQYTYDTFAFDKVGQRIDLGGSTAMGGRVVLDEMGVKTESTGIWTGIFSPNRLSFTGTWESPDGKLTLPLALAAVVEYRTVKIEQGKYHLEGEYPSFLIPSPALRTLNRLLPQRVIEGQQRFRKQTASAEADSPRGIGQDYRISIGYFADDLVSLVIVVDDRSQYQGSPAPSTDVWGANYYIGEAKPRLLRLSDLFIRDKAFETTLLQQVTAGAEQQTPHLLRNLTMNDLTSWTLAARGITFLISGKWNRSFGYYTVNIPYTALEKYLNPQGPLFDFLYKGTERPAAAKEPVTGLSTEAILAMGRSKFVDRYQAALKNVTEFQTREAFDAYTRIRALRNDAIQAVLPANRRQFAFQVRRWMHRADLARFDADAAISYGTDLLDFAAADGAEMEDTAGAVLASLQHPAVNRSARRRAVHDMRIAQEHLAGLVTPASTPKHPGNYKKAVAEMKHSINALTQLLPQLPDAAAAEVAAFALETTVLYSEQNEV